MNKTSKFKQFILDLPSKEVMDTMEPADVVSFFEEADFDVMNQWVRKGKVTLYREELDERLLNGILVYLTLNVEYAEEKELENKINLSKIFLEEQFGQNVCLFMNEFYAYKGWKKAEIGEFKGFTLDELVNISYGEWDRMIDSILTFY